MPLRTVGLSIDGVFRIDRVFARFVLGHIFFVIVFAGCFFLVEVLFAPGVVADAGLQKRLMKFPT
jgi:uncharacterized membrane protein